MSVVLVIAVGLFFLRDNIAKFINNAATQITGEESRPEGMNKYGFYFDKKYAPDGEDTFLVFREDGSMETIDKNGNVLHSAPAGYASYSSGAFTIEGYTYNFSPDGKSLNMAGLEIKLQE